MQRLPQALVRPTADISRLSHSTKRQFHKDYRPDKEEQSFKLSNGRRIGFAEYGSPKGIPTFFFHGAPGCRYDGLEYHKVGQKLGVRVISPDRPGHGLSDHYDGRQLSDYPEEISQLAKHLGTKKYNVFGQSGGGPFALACALGSPKDELMNAAVVAGMCHPSILNVKNAGWYTVIALFPYRWMPGLLRYHLNWFYSKERLGDEEKLRKQLDKVYQYLTPEDRAEMQKPEIYPVVIASLRSAFAQGADGVLRDGQLYASPWDFELEDVKRKVKLFYGHKDDRTPIAFGRHLKEYLPDAELYEYEDASHFTIHKHYEDILSKIINNDGSAATQKETQKEQN